MADANIRAVINADDRASRVLSNFGDHVDGIGGKIAAAMKVAAIGLAAGGAAATAFGVLSVKAFNESEQAIAQTNAVLKSTGGIAGVTADQVDKLSKSLQKTTKFSDEEVRSVENLLLTFTSISKDIFPDATKTVLDMATALGEDTKSASVQLGKALQDPILGITALRRVGVNFSDAQKDVIKNLVETGHKAEAQKAILKELQVEFGGSAEAAGNTFAGQLAKLKNSFNDVQEKIGEVIVKNLGPFVTHALEAVAAIDWDAEISATVKKLSELGDSISGVVKKVSDYLEPKFAALWNTIKDKLWPAIQDLAKAIGPALGVGLVGAIGLATDALNIFLTVLSPIIQFLADHTWIVWGLVGAFVAFRAALLIEQAVAAFQGALLVLNAAMVFSGSVAGGLRLLLLGILGPWQIVLAIIGVAAVIAGIKEVADWLDTLFNKWNRNNKVGLGNSGIKVSGNSDIGLTQQLMNAFKGFRAGGGMVSAGSSYVIGEQGPELFVPNKSGTIIPNDKLGQTSTPSTININLNAGFFNGTDVEARKYAMQIASHLKDIASSKSMSVQELMG